MYALFIGHVYKMTLLLRYVSNLVLLMTSFSGNPYLHQTAYDTHYAQAYMRTQPVTIPETSPLRLPSSSAASWYRPGSCRCSYRGCSFAASQKALEIHMMDRHLIYPPGWEKRPKKSDWDADPTLKGWVHCIPSLCEAELMELVVGSRSLSKEPA